MGNKLKKIISIHCALIVFFYGLTAFAENKYFLAPPHTPVSIINADILFRIVLEAKFELLRKDAPIKIYLGNHSFSVPPALRKHVYLVRIKTANKSSMYVPWNEKKARNINRIEMVDKQNPHNRLIFRLSKKEVSIERQLNGNTLEYHSFERSKKRGYSKPLRAYPIFLNFEDNAYNFPTSEPGIPFTERADKIFRMLTARGNIHSQASNSLTIGRYTVRLPDAYRLSGDRNAGRTVLTTKSKDQGRGSRFATIFDRLNHAIRLVFESRLEWIIEVTSGRAKKVPSETQTTFYTDSEFRNVYEDFDRKATRILRGRILSTTLSLGIAESGSIRFTFSAANSGNLSYVRHEGHLQEPTSLKDSYPCLLYKTDELPLLGNTEEISKLEDSDLKYDETMFDEFTEPPLWLGYWLNGRIQYFYRCGKHRNQSSHEIVYRLFPEEKAITFVRYHDKDTFTIDGIVNKSTGKEVVFYGGPEGKIVFNLSRIVEKFKTDNPWIQISQNLVEAIAPPVLVNSHINEPYVHFRHNGTIRLINRKWDEDESRHFVWPFLPEAEVLPINIPPSLAALAQAV